MSVPKRQISYIFSLVFGPLCPDFSLDVDIEANEAGIWIRIWAIKLESQCSDQCNEALKICGQMNCLTNERMN